MIFSTPVLLVGNGPFDAGAVALARPYCGAVVAADGGAQAALAQGLVLDATIGDMDSFSPDSDLAYGKIIRISEQDSTDFAKCLRIVSAPFFLGTGFLGGRLDHELAALNTLVKTRQNVVLIGEVDLVFRLPRFARISLPIGTRVSAFPMGAVSGVSSTGLEWPLDGLQLAADGNISTSNRSTAPEITFTNPDQPLLCILPRAHLAATLMLFNS